MSRPVGDAPLCDCHGEPRYWHKDDHKPNGGYWRCRIRNTENGIRYRNRNPEKHRQANARRIRAGNVYLGTVGFTDSEVKEMISGSSD